MKLTSGLTVSFTIFLLTTTSLPLLAEEHASSNGSFPDFDYEVICYASNIFVQRGGSEGLASIADCKKDEEAVRDYMREVWPKLLPEGRASCVDYARQFARGSFNKLRECVALGALQSLKDGLLVRARTKP